MRWPRMRIRRPKWLRWLAPWRGRGARRRRDLLLALGVPLAVVGVGLLIWLLAKPRRALDCRELAVRYGNAAGLDPELVLAIIQNESAGDPKALSRVGARGLMQLMPRTAEDVARRNHIRYRGPDDLFDPDLNVRLGTLYLAQLRRMFRGDPYLYIAAYNAGPGNVESWCAEHPGLPSREVIERAAFRETRSYVRRVLRTWHAAKNG